MRDGLSLGKNAVRMRLVREVPDDDSSLLQDYIAFALWADVVRAAHDLGGFGPDTIKLSN